MSGIGHRARRRRPPVALLIPAGLAVALFALPLIGLVGRTPWTDLPTLLATPTVTQALRLSLITSFAAAAASTSATPPRTRPVSRAAARRPVGATTRPTT